MDRVHPFSDGAEFADWQTHNCDRCAKYNDDLNISCEIDRALAEAYIDDGSVSPGIAKRVGMTETGHHTWDCPEREVKDA